MMKRLFALAAFLLASTAAQAQYSFDYGGRTIRIDPDRGTVSIPGVYDNTGRRKRAHSDRDGDHPRKQAPEQAKVEPLTPVQPDAAPPAVVAPANRTPDPSTTTANVAPADTAPSPPPPANTPATVPAPAAQDAAPAAAPSAPAPAVVTAPPPPPAPAQKQAAAAPTSNMQPSTTPLGLWLTEEKEGQVRIEQCGASLCGYSVDKKSNQNGEQVLINMKPAKDSKWSGRILDPNTGSTYDSTIAMKGSDTLRVQGCAFGGMFCGGQTWSRVN
jgi:uncharacterized protein (DUF2147 family)